MNSIHGLVLRVAALVVGSALVGAGIASNPATAKDVTSMLGAVGLTRCSLSTPCKKFQNNGSGAGVEGLANTGNGVIALSTSGSATLSTSTNGDGVQAYSSNNDGTNSGTNNSSSLGTAKSGVWGHDDSTDGGTQNAGVSGSSNNGTGVSGTSTNGYGVSGNSIDQFAAGVRGTSTNGYGVSGSSTAQFAAGVRGDSTDGPGVIGFSANSYGGVFENSAFSDRFTLIAQNDGSGYPFGASGSGGDVTIDNLGDVIASGTMYAQGFVTQLHTTTNDGRHVSAYASQSADAEMSDVGTSRIAAGHGIVQLDPTFARTLDMRSGYHVFLTPMGDCKGLFIASKSPASFEVRELQGGQSTLSFDYRVIGRAAGVKTGRLPAIRFTAPKFMREHAPGHAPIH